MTGRDPGCGGRGVLSLEALGSLLEGFKYQNTDIDLNFVVNQVTRKIRVLLILTCRSILFEIATFSVTMCLLMEVLRRCAGISEQNKTLINMCNAAHSVTGTVYQKHCIWLSYNLNLTSQFEIQLMITFYFPVIM